MLGGHDRHPCTIDRGDRIFAEELLVPIIVGVRDNRDAGAEKLGAGGRDQELAAAFDPEAEIVEEALPGPVLDLGLGDSGLEVDVPHIGRLEVIDLSLFHQIEEAELRDLPAVVVDGRVLLGPIEGQSEVAPQVFERLLVLGRDQPARLDEVAAGDLLDLLALAAFGVRLPVGIVGQVGVATDAEQVLHPALGGQPVVVPAHREGDVLADHPLVAHQQIFVGVAENVTYVQRAGDRRRRGVDHEGLIAGNGGIPSVDAPLVPALPPLLLDLDVLVLLGNLDLRHRIPPLRQRQRLHPRPARGLG